MDVIGVFGVGESGKTYFVNQFILENYSNYDNIIVFANINQHKKLVKLDNIELNDFYDFLDYDLESIKNSLIFFDDFDALLLMTMSIKDVKSTFLLLQQYNNHVIYTAKILQELPDIVKSLTNILVIKKLTHFKDLNYLKNYLNDEEIKKISSFSMKDRLIIYR